MLCGCRTVLPTPHPVQHSHGHREQCIKIICNHLVSNNSVVPHSFCLNRNNLQYKYKQYIYFRHFSWFLACFQYQSMIRAWIIDIYLNTSKYSHVNNSESYKKHHHQTYGVHQSRFRYSKIVTNETENIKESLNHFTSLLTLLTIYSSALTTF